MAVALDLLVPRLTATLVPPGSEAGLFPTDDDSVESWVPVLANAFWMCRLHRFFTAWRLNVAGDTIQPVASGGADMPGEYQQLIVLSAAVATLEVKLLEFNTKFRAKSGEEEFEAEKAASLLVELIRGWRRQLEDIREDLVTREDCRTNVAVIDLVVERLDRCYPTWVGA